MTSLMTSTANKFILRQSTISITGEPVVNHDYTQVFDSPPTTKVTYGRVVSGLLSNVFKKSARIVKNSDPSNFYLKVTLSEVLEDGENILITKEFRPRIGAPVSKKLVEEVEALELQVPDNHDNFLSATKRELVLFLYDKMEIFLKEFFTDNPEVNFVFSVNGVFYAFCYAGMNTAGQHLYREKPVVRWINTCSPIMHYHRDMGWIDKKPVVNSSDYSNFPNRMPSRKRIEEMSVKADKEEVLRKMMTNL